jgi:SAM-dependent methyltransferase
MMDETPLLYAELSDWWPVLSTPEDYEEEALFYQRVIQEACSFQPKTMLELGSGGGNNASHLKKTFDMTLVDLSPGMLEVSKALNPDLEHLEGDMRTVRLGRVFDAVFIHDAIVYMNTEDDLRKAIETAYVHLRSGGVALFAPDHTRETYKPSTSHGGHDCGERSLRYLAWDWDPDESDSTAVSYMVYLLREGTEDVRCVVDRHLVGLFSQKDWLRLVRAAGFEGKAIPFEHSEIELGTCDVFVGVK